MLRRTRLVPNLSRWFACCLSAIVLLAVCFSTAHAVAPSSQGDWWMTGHDAQHTGRTSAIGPAEPPALKWTFETGSFVGPTPVFSADGAMYEGSTDGCLYAINPNGSERWRLEIGGSLGYSPAVAPDGNIYITSYDEQTNTSKLVAANPDGTKAWEYGENAYGSPAIGPDGSIYIQSLDKKLLVLGPDGAKKWEFATVEACRPASALGTDGTVYVVCSARIYAINANQTLRWELTFGGTLSNLIAVGSDGTVYAVATGRGLYALDPDNGSQRWLYPLNSTRGESPVIGSDGTIYVCLYQDGLTAVNPDGSLKWHLPVDTYGDCPVLDANGTMYMTTRNSTIVAANPDGTEKWTLSLGSPAGRFLTMGPDGTLYTHWDGDTIALGPGAAPVPPLISISEPISTTTTSGPVTYTITYANATDVTLSPADVTLNLTGTANGTVSVSGTGAESRTVTISGITGSGTIGISLAAGTASNEAGQALATGPSMPVQVIPPPPSVSISAPSVSATVHGPVSYTVTYTGADDVTLTADDVQLNRTPLGYPLTLAGDVAVTGSGNTRTVTISNIVGDGSMGISIRAGTASNAGGSASKAGPSAWFQVRSAPPKIEIGPPSPRSVRSGWWWSEAGYEILCNDNVPISLSAADITVNRTGTANGVLVIGEAGRGVGFQQLTGEGTLSISIRAGVASNVAGASEATGPSETIAVVNKIPSVKIGKPSAGLTARGPVTYTITYTGVADVNLRTADVALIRSGSANGTVSLTGSGVATRTVTISNITGEGSLRISIPRGTALNAIGVASAPDRSEAFQVTNTLPTLKVGAPSKSSTKSGPVSYTITYSRAAAIGLSPANVHLVTTGTANGTISVTGSGTTTRKVTISDITGDGTLGISIDAGSASNVAGDTAAAIGAAFAVVNSLPQISVSAPSVSTTRTGPVTFIVQYPGATSVSLSSSKVHLLKTGTATGRISVTGTGTSSRTITISSITGDGTLAISIDGKSATNLAGSAPAAGPSTAFAVDSKL